MTRTSSPANVGEPGTGDSAATPSLRPLVFMVLALLAVGALVGLSVLDTRPSDEVPAFAEDPHPGWIWLGGLFAGGLMMTAGAIWWRAERRATRHAARDAEPGPVNAAAPPNGVARGGQLAVMRRHNIRGFCVRE